MAGFQSYFCKVSMFGAYFSLLPTDMMHPFTVSSQQLSIGTQPQPIVYIAPRVSASITAPERAAANATLTSANFSTYKEHVLNKSLLGTVRVPLRYLELHESQRSLDSQRVQELKANMQDHDLCHAHPMQAILHRSVSDAFKLWYDNAIVQGSTTSKDSSSLENLPDLCTFDRHGSANLRVFAGQHRLAGWKLAMLHIGSEGQRPMYHDAYPVEVYHAGKFHIPHTPCLPHLNVPYTRCREWQPCSCFAHCNDQFKCG
jgi:hypothetical protein